MPEGLNGTLPAPLGKFTTSGPPCGLPLPSYRVEVWVPLLETHTGVWGQNTIPQGLTRLASVVTAPRPGVSVTRLVNEKVLAAFTVSIAVMETVVPDMPSMPPIDMPMYPLPLAAVMATQVNA